MCLITNPSQGSDINLFLSRVHCPRAGPPQGTLPITRPSTIRPPSIPTSLQSLAPSRTTPTHHPSNLIPSPSRPPIPQPPPPQAPGSASRSKRPSLSPTPKQGGRLSRRTRPLLPANRPLSQRSRTAPSTTLKPLQGSKLGTLLLPLSKSTRLALPTRGVLFRDPGPPKFPCQRGVLMLCPRPLTALLMHLVR